MNSITINKEKGQSQVCRNWSNYLMAIFAISIIACNSHDHDHSADIEVNAHKVQYIEYDNNFELYAEADEQKRIETDLERRNWSEEKESVLEIDRQVNQTMDTCRILAELILLASGYHTHKGTWRRMRVKRD